MNLHDLPDELTGGKDTRKNTHTHILEHHYPIVMKYNEPGARLAEGCECVRGGYPFSPSPPTAIRSVVVATSIAHTHRHTVSSLRVSGAVQSTCHSLTRPPLHGFSFLPWILCEKERKKERDKEKWYLLQSACHAGFHSDVASNGSDAFLISSFERKKKEKHLRSNDN